MPDFETFETEVYSAMDHSPVLDRTPLVISVLKKWSVEAPFLVKIDNINCTLQKTIEPLLAENENFNFPYLQYYSKKSRINRDAYRQLCRPIVENTDKIISLRSRLRRSTIFPTIDLTQGIYFPWRRAITWALTMCVFVWLFFLLAGLGIYNFGSPSDVEELKKNLTPIIFFLIPGPVALMILAVIWEAAWMLHFRQNLARRLRVRAKDLDHLIAEIKLKIKD